MGEKMFIKWDRFLGKFKKDPPHIGEYEKKVHFQGGKSPMVSHYNVQYDTYGYNTNTNTKYEKYEKYENTSRKNKILFIYLLFYIILDPVTSWMNIKYTYIIEFKLLLARDRIEPLSGGKSFIL